MSPEEERTWLPNVPKLVLFFLALVLFWGLVMACYSFGQWLP